MGITLTITHSHVSETSEVLPTPTPVNGIEREPTTRGIDSPTASVR